MTTVKELIAEGAIAPLDENAASSALRFTTSFVAEISYHQEVTPTWNPRDGNYLHCELFLDGVPRVVIRQRDICMGHCAGARSASGTIDLPGPTNPDDPPQYFSLRLKHMSGTWAASGTNWRMYPRLKIITDGNVVFDRPFEIPVDPRVRTLAPGEQEWVIRRG